LKSIEDTLADIDERIIAEEEDLKQMHKDGDGNTQGAWECRAVLEELRDLRLWILEL
jgi:hypothetical protein